MIEVYEARRKAFLMFDKYCKLNPIGFSNMKAQRGQRIWTMRVSEATKEYNYWNICIKMRKLALEKEKLK